MSNQADPRKSRRRVSGLIVITALLFFGAGLFAGTAIHTTTSTSDPELSKLEKIYSLLTTNWYYAENRENLEEELIEQALKGMTTLKEDPHTTYFSLDEAQAFSQSLSGSNVGIGFSFYVNGEGNVAVRQVFINSPADRAGLQAGDVILKVDDKTASENSSDDLVSYIKTRDGKQVTLEVLRDGQVQEMTVVPGSYDLTVSCQVNGDVGEIVLSSFSENSGRDFADAVGRLKNAGVSELIIDLRNNTGGYIRAALDIASSLLGDDNVVFLEKTADGQVKEYYTNSSYNQVEFDHIAILTNANTASASEILIGALKDNLGQDKVTLIGSTTYGKGTEQTSLPFADGTSVKYTIAEWLTPNGISINLTGFEPDMAVEDALVRTVAYYQMEESETIEPDTVGINAAAAQIFLQFLGYDVDRTDAYFSPASSLALAQFQADSNLEATGIIDAQTFEALVSAAALQINEQDLQLDHVRNTAIALLESYIS